MTNAEYADGLRKMADLIEGHPEFGVPCSYQTVSIFPHCDDQKAHAASVIRSLGNCEKIYDGEDFRLQKKVGVHTLWVWYQRKEICRRVVIGTELVAAQPERLIPAMPAHEREIVEWVCSPVLNPLPVQFDDSTRELVGSSTPQLQA